MASKITFTASTDALFRARTSARAASGILEGLVRTRLASRLQLRPLPLDAVQSMLAALGGEAPPPLLARVIFEATEGNPFFVEEVFRHLVEEGRLFDKEGGWQQGLRPDDLHVPDSVRLVISRRMARLSQDTRRVLTTAAVIGRSFSTVLLENLEATRPDVVLDAVEEAEQARVVAAEPGSHEPRYRFVHELMRQTIVETLSLPRRQRLHARVAEAIERTHPTALEANASAIALHLYQAGAAGDPARATHYMTLAARLAREAAAHEESLVLLENALSLRPGERNSLVADLISQKGVALRSLRRHDDAEQAFNHAI